MLKIKVKCFPSWPFFNNKTPFQVLRTRCLAVYEPVCFFENLKVYKGFPGGTSGKNYLPMQEKQEMRVPSPGREDPLEEGVATRSSALAWRILWTEEPGGYEGTHPRLV